MQVSDLTKFYVPCPSSSMGVTLLPAEGVGDAHSDAYEEGQSLGMTGKEKKDFLGDSCLVVAEAGCTPLPSTSLWHCCLPNGNDVYLPVLKNGLSVAMQMLSALIGLSYVVYIFQSNSLSP